jgi:hypothetical protein
MYFLNWEMCIVSADFFRVYLVLSEKASLSKAERNSLQVLWPSVRAAHLETKCSHEGDPSQCEVDQAREGAEGERERSTTEH